MSARVDYAPPSPAFPALTVLPPLALPQPPKQQLRAIDYVIPVCTLALCFTIFSGYTIVVKQALNDGTSPLVLAFLREILALSVLMPYSFMTVRWRSRQPGGGGVGAFWISQSDWGWIILLGLSMVYGVQLLSALALKAVTALNYALLAPSVPPMCLALSLLTGYEYFDRHSRESWLKVGGIAVCVVGSIVVAVTASAEAGGKASTTVIIGNILLFGNKISIATYPIIEKKMIEKGYDPVSIVAWGYASGSALTLLGVIPYLVLDAGAAAASGAASPFNISGSGWLAICYAAFLTSAFNYAAMIWVNRRVGPVLVMMFYPWQAVCTPLLAFLFLGSTLSSNDVVGGLLIVAGLALCVVAKWRERVAAAGAEAARGAGVALAGGRGGAVHAPLGAPEPPAEAAVAGTGHAEAAAGRAALLAPEKRGGSGDGGGYASELLVAVPPEAETTPASRLEPPQLAPPPPPPPGVSGGRPPI